MCFNSTSDIFVKIDSSPNTNHLRRWMSIFHTKKSVVTTAVLTCDLWFIYISRPPSLFHQASCKVMLCFQGLHFQAIVPVATLELTHKFISEKNLQNCVQKIVCGLDIVTIIRAIIEALSENTCHGGKGYKSPKKELWRQTCFKWCGDRMRDRQTSHELD